MEVQQYITMNMVIQLKHNQITYDFYMVLHIYYKIRGPRIAHSNRDENHHQFGLVNINRK